MEEQKKTEEQQTPATEVQFEKNIKTLWIYTTLFCLFALVLIVVSSLIQSKINSRAEYYQSQYESEQTANRSTIKNISDENAALKQDLARYKSRAEALEAQTAADSELLAAAADLAENEAYLAMAQSALMSGNYEKARAEFKKIDAERLSEELQEAYAALQKRIG